MLILLNSTLESRPAWSVAAMNLAMAVRARSAHRKTRIRPGGLSMAHRMALEAQSRRRYLERELVDGAVRIVTGEAVLAHRRVLEQIRPALFRVAFVAVVFD
jgi:hypothetical protein